MNEKNIEARLEEMDRKLDLVFEEVYRQRQKRQEWEDLASDLSIIGTDAFETAVQKLDKAGVEVDYEALERFGLRMMRNFKTFNGLLETLESANDLWKDISPILSQAGLDMITRMDELERKGYLDFLKEVGSILDNVIGHFTVEDVRQLADNIVTILETVKNLTQPDMLKAINNAVNVYKLLDNENVTSVSMWKAFRELNSPEGKKAIGFALTFMKKLAAGNDQKAA